MILNALRGKLPTWDNCDHFFRYRAKPSHVAAWEGFDYISGFFLSVRRASDALARVESSMTPACLRLRLSERILSLIERSVRMFGKSLRRNIDETMSSNKAQILIPKVMREGGFFMVFLFRLNKPPQGNRTTRSGSMGREERSLHHGKGNCFGGLGPIASDNGNRIECLATGDLTLRYPGVAVFLCFIHAAAKCLYMIFCLKILVEVIATGCAADKDYEGYKPSECNGVGHLPAYLSNRFNRLSVICCGIPERLRNSSFRSAFC